MIRVLKITLGLCLGLYVLAVGVMYTTQRSILYYPTHTVATPQLLDLQQVSVIDLTAPDGGTSQLWYAPATANKPTILFFHGNAGQATDRAPRMRAYLSQGYGIAFMSYRGFGESHVQITEAGMILDSQTAYDWLMTQGVPAASLIVVGESLGTGVAVQIAAANPVKAVALGAPYSSTVDVAAARFWWLPVRLLMKDQFRSDRAMPQITAPILIQHGNADTIVPYRFGQKLAGLARSPVTFITLEGRGHEAIFEQDSFDNEINYIEALPKT